MSKLKSLVIPNTKSREAFTPNDVSSFESFKSPAIGYKLKGVGGSHRAKLLKICLTNDKRMICPPFEDLNIGVKKARSKTRCADTDFVARNSEVKS